MSQNTCITKAPQVLKKTRKKHEENRKSNTEKAIENRDKLISLSIQKIQILSVDLKRKTKIVTAQPSATVLQISSADLKRNTKTVTAQPAATDEEIDPVEARTG